MLLPADQTFKSLVIGIIKHLYYPAEGVTLEAIKGLYDGSIDAGEVENELNTFVELFRKAGEASWDNHKLEQMLGKLSLKEDYSKIILLVYNNEKEKIHDAMYQKSKWNNSLKEINWRIDVKTASSKGDATNEPIALVELSTSKSTAKFSMDKQQISDIMTQFNQIQKKIEEASF